MNVETINQYGEKYSQTPTFVRLGCRAIIIKDNKILLSHEKNTGVYLTPGGGLESGESPEECVMREVREETGYTVSVVKPFVKVNEYFYEKLYVSNYFVCEIKGKAEQSLTETEIIHGVGPEWVDIGKALDVFGNYANVADEELAAQYKREFTVLNKFTDKKMRIMTFNIQHCLDYQTIKSILICLLIQLKKLIPISAV